MPTWDLVNLYRFPSYKLENRQSCILYCVFISQIKKIADVEIWIFSACEVYEEENHQNT